MNPKVSSTLAYLIEKSKEQGIKIWSDPTFRRSLYLMVGSTIASKALKIYANYVKRNTILEIDLDHKTIVEVKPIQYFPKPIPQIYSARELVSAIRYAATDSRIKALYVKIGNIPFTGCAQVEELRRAVLYFKSQGKKTYLHSDSMGEFQNGFLQYWFASVFDHISMPECGEVYAIGTPAYMVFVRDMLDKLGLKPAFDQRKEYKGFVDMINRSSSTEPVRENQERILQSIYKVVVNQILEQVNKRRSSPLSYDDMITVMDKGPLSATEAQAIGMIDDVMYRDEIYTRIITEQGLLNKKGDNVTKAVKSNFLFVHRYLAKREIKNHLYEKKAKNKIAVITANGNVMRGESKHNEIVASETITRAFRQATEDKHIKAILLRIDSRGGSYVASDLILREVVKARAAGKIVVASMSNVAASGGYYIAMGADKIYAEATTLTGSIGVGAGKFITQGMWKKLGINWEHTTANSMSTYNTGTVEYSEEQWSKLQNQLDRIYEDFTAKAAKHRKMSREAMEQVAKGQIWNGIDAKEAGLVDALGGYEESVEGIKELLGMTAETKVQLVDFPLKVNVVQKLLTIPNNNENVVSEGSVAGAVGSGLSSLMVHAVVSPVNAFLQKFGVQIQATETGPKISYNEDFLSMNDFSI